MRYLPREASYLEPSKKCFSGIESTLDLLDHGENALDAGRGAGGEIDVLPVAGDAAISPLDVLGHLATHHLQTSGVGVGAHRLTLAAIQNGTGALLYVLGIVG